MIVLPGKRDDELEPAEPQEPQAPLVVPKPNATVTPQEPAVKPTSLALPHPKLSAFDAIQQEHNAAVSAAFQHALDTTPDAAAEAQKIARQMGRDTDPAFIGRNLDVARAFLQQQHVKSDAFTKQFPYLASKLADAKFVSMTRDDLGNLQTTEGSWDWVGRSWDVARGTSRLGTMGTVALFEGRGFTEMEKAERRRIQDLARAHAEREPGWIASGINLAGSFLDSIAAGVAVGGATAVVAPPAAPFAAGAAMFSQSWRLEAGNLYGDLIDQGYTPAEAAETAAIYGTAIAAVDLIGTRAVAKPLRTALGDALPKLFARGLTAETKARAFGDALKQFGQSIAIEPATEALQEVIGMIGKERLRAESRPDASSEFDLRQARDVFVETFKGMVVLGGIGGTAHTIVNLRKAADATHTARAFKHLSEVEEASKLGGRSVDDRAEFVNQTAGKAGMGTTYLRADKFLEVLGKADESQSKEVGRATNAETLEKVMPGLLNQVKDAAETGGSVALPTGDFMANLSRTEVGRALMEHATFTADGMTPFEGKEAKKQATTLVADAKKAIEEQGKLAEQWRTEAESVRTEVYDALRKAGQVPELATLNAALTKAMVVVNARNEGLTPAAYWQENGFSVRQGETAAAPDVFAQQPDEAGDAQQDVAQSMLDAAPSWLSGMHRGLAKKWAAGEMTDEQVVETLLGKYRTERGDFDKVGDTLTENQDGTRDLTIPELDATFNVSSTSHREAFAMARESALAELAEARDQSLLRKDSQGSYSPSLRAIFLNAKADASTFVHELVHWNLEEMGRIAALGRMAGAQAQQDMRILLDWADFSGTLQEWRAQSLDERRAVHEKVARSYEQFLYEGKAPSKALRDVFSRLGRLIRAAYREIIGAINAAYRQETGEDLPGLTPEVRHVFGRMLASEDVIRQMRDSDGFVGLFQTQEEFVKAGGKPKDWAALQQRMRDEEDAAVDELTASRMGEVGWLGNARAKALKDIQREHDEVRGEVRREAEAEVDAMPVSRARLWLTTGRLVDETGRETRDDADATHTLQRDAVQAMTPPGTDSEVLGKVEMRDGLLVPAKGSMVTEDGVHPDAVAQSLGYETGQQLVEDLLTTPPRDEMVRFLTDERMVNENSGLVDPDQVEAAVRAAVHNKARRRTIAAELRVFDRNSPSERILTEAAREAARQAMAGRTLASIQVREFSAAASRARAAAREAFKAGDLPAARDAKRQELLNDALAAEAAAARTEVRGALKLFAKAFRPDKKLAATRDLNVVHVIRAVLALYGIGRGDKTPGQHLAPVQAYAEATFNDLLSVVQDAVVRSAALPPGDDRYQSMTLDAFRDLHAQVNLLWQQSRLMRQVTLDGRKVQSEAAQTEAIATLSRLPEKAPLGAKGSLTGLETSGGWVADYLANLTRVEHLFRFLDGGNTNGIFTRLFRRVKKAGDQYRKQLRGYSKRIDQSLKALNLGPSRRIVAPELGGHVFGRGAAHGKAEVIGFALHFLGNKSNRDKLIGAKERQGWTDAGAQAFIDRMMDEGMLTAADFAYMQGVWDLNEEVKPLLQKAHFDLLGYNFEEVVASPFTNRFGLFRGGYVPATVDRDLVGDVEITEANQRAEFIKSIPAVPRGMTITRVEKYRRPLSLNLAGQVEHMSQVLRFVHMATAVRDVRRVLDAPEVKARLERDVGKTVISSVINPWLKNSSLQTVGTPPGNPIEKAVDFMRRSASMNTMFLNLGNALQNVTGLFPLLREVGPRHVLASLLRYGVSPRATAAAVAERSTHMANRLEQQVFDVYEQVRNHVVKPGLIRRGARYVSRHTYVLQTITQNFVDVIGADAAYHQEVAKQLKAGANEAAAHEQAVNVSDSLVRRTQMAGDPEDVSKFESGGPLMKALLPFKGWFINWANHTVTSAKLSDGIGDTVATYVYVVMLPTVLAGFISQVVAGRIADDDDDGWGDEAVQLWWKSQIDTALGATVGIGDVAKTAVNVFYDDDVWNDRMSAPPFAQMIQRLLRETSDIKKQGFTAANIRDGLTALGELTGLPVRALGSRVRYISETTPEATLEYLRGAATGRAATGAQ